jgi:hypothetical protein
MSFENAIKNPLKSILRIIERTGECGGIGYVVGSGVDLACSLPPGTVFGPLFSAYLSISGYAIGTAEVVSGENVIPAVTFNPSTARHKDLLEKEELLRTLAKETPELIQEAYDTKAIERDRETRQCRWERLFGSSDIETKRNDLPVRTPSPNP